MLRTLLRTIFLSIFGTAPILLLLLSGCDQLSSAKGSLDNAKGQADSTKGQVDSTKDQIKGMKGDKGDKGGGGAEAGQDEDGDRLHAKEAEINQPLSDKVDYLGGDKCDWRKFQLLGKPGIATFELHWDEEASNLELDVYDAYGTNIGRSPPRMEGSQVKKILVRIPKTGVYYVRVNAPTVNDKSIYTLAVTWNGPAAPIVKTEPKTTAGDGKTPPPADTTPAVPLPFAQDPTKLLGNIVSSHQEGSAWIFYLDRGAANKVKVGLTGAVLEGADGDKLLEGGNFTITKVVDGGRSIARSSLQKSPGRNTRIVVNLK